jgi:hypothetical protein
MGPRVDDLMLGIVSFVVGLSGLIYGLVRSFAGKPAARFTVKTPRGIVTFELRRDLSEQQRGKLIDELKHINAAPTAHQHKPPPSSKPGFVVSDLLFWVVPSLMALGFATVYLGLIWEKRDDPNYQVPESLQNTLAVILGYFFGSAANNVANRGKPLSFEEAAAIFKQGK